jgi:hypothetical protein
MAPSVQWLEAMNAFDLLSTPGALQADTIRPSSQRSSSKARNFANNQDFEDMLAEATAAKRHFSRQAKERATKPKSTDETSDDEQGPDVVAPLSNPQDPTPKAPIQLSAFLALLNSGAKSENALQTDDSSPNVTTETASSFVTPSQALSNNAANPVLVRDSQADDPIEPVGTNLASQLAATAEAVGQTNARIELTADGKDNPSIPGDTSGKSPTQADKQLQKDSPSDQQAVAAQAQQIVPVQTPPSPIPSPLPLPTKSSKNDGSAASPATEKKSEKKSEPTASHVATEVNGAVQPEWTSLTDWREKLDTPTAVTGAVSNEPSSSPRDADVAPQSAPSSVENGVNKADNLSFAMRLQGEKATAQQTGSSGRAEVMRQPDENLSKELDQQSGPTTNGNLIVPIEPVAKQRELQRERVLDSVVAPVADHSAPARQNEPQAQSSQAQSTTMTENEKPITEKSEPVRNIQVQLAGENSERVNLKMMDVGGELRLSVRTSDPALAQALQDRMPELTGRLEQQNYRTEVWTPRVAASEQSNASHSGASSSQADSSPHEHDQPGRRQNQQRNQPDWFDELES